jgi:hypothetical protein
MESRKVRKKHGGGITILTLAQQKETKLECRPLAMAGIARFGVILWFLPETLFFIA